MVFYINKQSIEIKSRFQGAPLTSTNECCCAVEIVAEKLGHTKLDTTRQCYASISRATVHNAHNKYIS